MRLDELPSAAIEERLLTDAGVGLDFGCARARIRGDAVGLAEVLRTIYASFPAEDNGGFFDATVALQRPLGLRRWLRPQVEFFCDGAPLFEPFPADTHLPLLEWGLNYLFAERLNHHLILHAGVVERDGRAVILPAMPGSGKSTLTAALSLSGFRLLSDEFGVVRLSDAQLLPLLRPIALKNESIEVIRRFDSRARLGHRFEKTRKGTVAHLAPMPSWVESRDVPARPALIVFPLFDPSVELEVEAVPRARAFAKLAVNSFNYEILGPLGFDTVGRLVAASRCYRLVYRDLDRAISTVCELLASAD
jgi:hypothetical protein